MNHKTTETVNNLAGNEPERYTNPLAYSEKENISDSPYFVPDHLKIQKNTHTNKEVSMLVFQIRSCHDSVCNSEKTIISAKFDALKAAITCGGYLLRAKELVEHGQWEKFLRDYFWQSLSARTANNYMRLAQNRDKLDFTEVQSLRSAYISVGILKVGERKHMPTEERSVPNPAESPPSPTHADSRPNQKHVSDSTGETQHTATAPTSSAAANTAPTQPSSIQGSPNIVARSDSAMGQANANASHEDKPEVLPFAFYDFESGDICELEIVNGTLNVPLIGWEADRLDEMLSPLWAWMKRREAAVAASQVSVPFVGQVPSTDTVAPQQTCSVAEEIHRNPDAHCANAA